MRPTLCSKCRKNPAVVFITRMNEKNETVNEGLCLKCAAELNLPQVNEMMKRMGITPEDLENINNEMMQAFGGAEEMNDLPDGEDEDDEESGKTATFPFLHQSRQIQQIDLLVPQLEGHLPGGDALLQGLVGILHIHDVGDGAGEKARVAGLLPP